MIASEEDDQYIFVQEGDLDQILEEEDVLQALTSYQEIRKAVKDQQKGRGHYKGFLEAKGFGKNKSKGKWRIGSSRTGQVENSLLAMWTGRTLEPRMQE